MRQATGTQSDTTEALPMPAGPCLSFCATAENVAAASIWDTGSNTKAVAPMLGADWSGRCACVRSLLSSAQQAAHHAGSQREGARAHALPR